MFAVLRGIWTRDFGGYLDIPKTGEIEALTQFWKARFWITMMDEMN
jgi:hypothetical protein